MKELWVKADPWNKELVIAALEAGADAVMVPQDKVSHTKALGVIPVVADGGDIQWGQDVVYVEVRSASDEDRIVELSREKRVVVRTPDWTVIPLENLVARCGNIMVEARDAEFAKMASGVLEKGVHGLIVTERDPDALRQIIEDLRSGKSTIEIHALKVRGVRSVGMGDRVCIDTCSLMGFGEGALVGNSSRTLFLVHAETLDNPYVPPRPFRINAGAVHAYVMVPGGGTRYLSELEAGHEILGVDAQGHAMTHLVGRVKIERRPLLLIEAEGPMGAGTLICQNAETIRFVSSTGEPVSVAILKAGDEVLGCVDDGGMHFGHKIHETIKEQ